MHDTDDRVVVLYIGGEGRSGSTILSEMLANLPGYVPVGELLGIWQAVRTDEQCECGAAFSECALWSAVGDRAFHGWEEVDVPRQLEHDRRFARVPRLPRLLLASAGWHDGTALAEYRSVLGRLYRAIQQETRAQVIVDSTKNPAYAYLLRGVPGVDVRYVHLVRDSRGVANSWSKEDIVIREYTDHPELAGTVISSQAPWKSALRWDVVNLVFPPVTPADRRCRITYESLVSDPVRQLARIVGLLGVPVADAHGTVEAATPFTARRGHTIGGNPVRFQVGPIQLRPDDEWRTRLTPAQKMVVSVLTAPLLKRYGYAVREAA